MVLGLEFEGNSVTDSGSDGLGSEDKSSRTTDNDLVIFGLDEGEGSDEEGGCEREQHLESLLSLKVEEMKDRFL